MVCKHPTQASITFLLHAFQNHEIPVHQLVCFPVWTVLPSANASNTMRLRHIADLLVGQFTHCWPQRSHAIQARTPFLIAGNSCWLQVVRHAHALVNLETFGETTLYTATKCHIWGVH